MFADRLLRSPAPNVPPLSLAVPAVTAVLALLFEVPRIFALVTDDPGITDFRRFYAAAEVGMRFGWPHIYDVALLREMSLPPGPGVAPDVFSLLYLNPPIVAWAVVPLTLLPLSAALVVWSAVNLFSLVAASRLVFPRGDFVWATAILVSIAVWPSVFSLERGQMGPIVYAFVVASLLMAEHGRQRWAGLFLALALAIKPQDVYLLPAVFFICGMLRAAAWWALGSAAFLALFAVVLGAQGIGTDLAVISYSASADPAFIARPFVAPFGPDASLLLGEALLVLLSLAAAWRQRRSLRIAFAIGIVGTLASGVHLHVYDYVGLAVAAWLVISESRGSLLDVGWLALGVVCAQLSAILIVWPILVWQDAWIVLLGMRRLSPSTEARRRLPA